MSWKYRILISVVGTIGMLIYKNYDPSEKLILEPDCTNDVRAINDFFSDRHGGLDWDIQAHNMETCIK